MNPVISFVVGFIDFLKGKKMYIMGCLMIILGLLNGDQKMVLEGITVLTARAAISKVSA